MDLDPGIRVDQVDHVDLVDQVNLTNPGPCVLVDQVDPSPGSRWTGWTR